MPLEALMTKHNDYIMTKLKDPEFASGYLKESLEMAKEDGSIEAFVLSLQQVLEAQGINKTKLAKEARISRDSLYKMDNPLFFNIVNVLSSTGIDISFAPSPKDETAQAS